ncbi:MAG: hypothetical protein GY771_14140 [bacterium]|nr:hypothetical protein [bacterium]
MKHILYIYLIYFILSGCAFAQEDSSKLHHSVDIKDNTLSFDAPSLRYEVKTKYIYPIAASLMHRKEDVIINITYESLVTYGDIDVDYGFLKEHLKKSENTFKKTKKNYERVSLEKINIAGKSAPELVFQTNSIGYWETSVIACFNEGLMIFFVSMACPEEIYGDVRGDFDALLASITIY